jgi:uncharacterized protein (DUF2147 family)
MSTVIAEETRDKRIFLDMNFKSGLKCAVVCITSSVFLHGLAIASPFGKWKTIDDKTGEPKSIVTIQESGGILTGKITQILSSDAPNNPVCMKCEDDRKGQPILGMEIIRGLKKDPNEEVWGGGEILSPTEGKIYKVKLKTIDNEKKLEVKGFWGPFSRTQTWVRVD